MSRRVHKPIALRRNLTSVLSVVAASFVCPILHSAEIAASKPAEESQAIRWAKQDVENNQKLFGPESKAVAQALCDLVLLYSRVEKWTEAEPYAKRALDIRRKVLKPDDPDLAKSLNDLATIYGRLGQEMEAEPLHLQALEIWEKNLKPGHAEILMSLANLAGLYIRIGDVAKAVNYNQRSLDFIEKAPAPDHPKVAIELNRLADYYSSIGDYAKAERALRRAIAMQRRIFGPDNPDEAGSLSRLVGLFVNMGDYAEAERVSKRAIEIYEKRLGLEHHWTAAGYTSLEALCVLIGDYAKAEVLAQKTLGIHQKGAETNQVNLVSAMSNLATVYGFLGKDKDAISLFQHSLATTRKYLAAEPPAVAGCYLQFGEFYLDRANYSEAEPLFQRASQIIEKAFPTNSPAVGPPLFYLARLNRSLGNYATAASLYQRILTLAGNSLGSGTMMRAAIYGDLAELRLAKHDEQDALAMAREAQRMHAEVLGRIFSFTSERGRMAFQAKLNPPYTVFASLGAAPEVASSMIRFKGAVLDSLLEDRLVAQASRSREDQLLLEQLRAAKQRLTQVLYEIPKQTDSQAELEALMSKLGNEVERLESALARRIAGLGRGRRAMSVTLQQVQKAIPKQAVLVDFLRYSHYLGTNNFEARYGAIVLASAGEPQWVPLGSAEAIERNIELYQNEVRGQSKAVGFSARLQSLCQQVWVPLEPVFPKATRTVVICPDAALNFISFATLLTPDDRFLSQKYSIRYASSGRDLLPEKRRPRRADVMIFGNPDFFGSRLLASTNAAENLVAMRSLERRDLQDFRFSPLPGATRESTALAAQAKKWDWSAQVYLGAEATEGQLRMVESPRVLHLATHGFFVPESQVGVEAHERWRGIGGVRPFSEPSLTTGIPSLLTLPTVFKNPMHRSGLALAGAQTTLDAWKRGEVPPTDNDGIVTADEVGTLKLDGTWLVVLSACDTGAGEARSGEGVLGLRRGFIQAGAQNLLLTLWKIADEETAKFMVDFYDDAHASGDAAQALAGVQRDWLVKLRKERNLQAAVQLAGPFILSSQGEVK